MLLKPEQTFWQPNAKCSILSDGLPLPHFLLEAFPAHTVLPPSLIYHKPFHHLGLLSSSPPPPLPSPPSLPLPSVLPWIPPFPAHLPPERGLHLPLCFPTSPSLAQDRLSKTPGSEVAERLDLGTRWICSCSCQRRDKRWLEEGPCLELVLRRSTHRPGRPIAARGLSSHVLARSWPSGDSAVS